MELILKVREELYFQNYMNDENAPGGTSVMQHSLREKPQRRRPGLDNRLKDDRGNRRERVIRGNDNEHFDRSENSQSGDFNNSDVAFGNNPDELMFDSFGGPLGPFVPAPPEVTMRMLREQGGPTPFEGGGRDGRYGPSPKLLHFGRIFGTCEDDEVTVIEMMRRQL